MTQEEQRTAIAEACGWTLNSAKHTAKGLDWLHVPSGNTAYNPPNYLNDLNAMHEAEKILPRHLYHVDYWQKGYGKFQTLLELSTITPYSATASQRAEAFLRTIGKWEEPKP